MKAMKWIVYASVLAVLGSLNVQAQDDAYMTPSRAREWRQKEEARIAKAKAERAERERKWQEENQKYQQQQDAVSDWYNRRDMNVTTEDMEENLENLDGKSTLRGGKYSQRLKRFGGDSDVIVLQNVDRVYVLNDMDYDPWTGSYYGRDWNNGVNISISMNPFGFGYGSYYNNWYDSYWGFGYPYYGYRGYRYYSPWYSGWYDPWYSGWYDPWYYSGWGGYYAYRPWRYGYYGAGYWDGYYDGAYSSRYHRNYNTYGRSSGSYYDRTARGADYGRALGQGSSTYTRSNNGYYDRSTSTRSARGYDRSGSNYNNRSTSRRSNVDQGWTYRDSGTSSRSSGSYTPSRSSSSSGGSYSAPSRPSNGGNSGGGTGRVRR